MAGSLHPISVHTITECNSVDLPKWPVGGVVKQALADGAETTDRNTSRRTADSSTNAGVHPTALAEESCTTTLLSHIPIRAFSTALSLPDARAATANATQILALPELHSTVLDAERRKAAPDR